MGGSGNGGAIRATANDHGTSVGDGNILELNICMVV